MITIAYAIAVLLVLVFASVRLYKRRKLRIDDNGKLVAKQPPNEPNMIGNVRFENTFDEFGYNQPVKPEYWEEEFTGRYMHKSFSKN